MTSKRIKCEHLESGDSIGAILQFELDTFGCEQQRRFVSLCANCYKRLLGEIEQLERESMYARFGRFLFK